jgi:integrase/recombinase XerD
MTKISIAAELKEHILNDGRQNVYIRITYNRKHYRINTNIKILGKEWSGKFGGWISSRNSNYKEFNNQIHEKITHYQKRFFELSSSSIKINVNDIISTEECKEYQDTNFILYWDKKVARMENYNQVKGYNTTRSKIISFTKSKAINFKDITPDWLQDFSNFCKPSLNSHSLYSQLKRVRAIYNYAIKEKIVDRSIYPFFLFKMPKIKQAEIEKLSKEQLISLFSLEYNMAELKFWVLAGFELSFRCAGIRIEDLLTLKWANVRDEKLIYRMNKGVTNGTIMSFELAGKLNDLLNKLKPLNYNTNDFILPFLKRGDDKEDNETYKKIIGNKTSLYNKYLKKIAKDAGLNIRLTSHLSRHSWAAYTYSQTLDIKFTQEYLGHSNSKVTEQYIGRLDISSKLEKFKQLEL